MFELPSHSVVGASETLAVHASSKTHTVLDCVWFLNDDQGYRQTAIERVLPDRIRTVNMNLRQFRSRFNRDTLIAQLK